MSTRKILWLTILAAFAALIVFYMEFQYSNRVEEGTEENTDVIRILAPYETKMHQQILQQVAKEYSRADGMPRFVFEFVPKENIKKNCLCAVWPEKEKWTQ